MLRWLLRQQGRDRMALVVQVTVVVASRGLIGVGDATATLILTHYKLMGFAFITSIKLYGFFFFFFFYINFFIKFIYIYIYICMYIF